MLNELLGGVLQLTPGYMEGRQQAIKDNWQDLSNYNQVRAGQMNNALFQATMPYKIQQSLDQTVSGHNQTEMSNNALNRDNRNTSDFFRIAAARDQYLDPLAAQQAYNALTFAQMVPRNMALRNYLMEYGLNNGMFNGGGYSPWAFSSLLNALGGGASNNSALPSVF